MSCSCSTLFQHFRASVQMDCRDAADDLPGFSVFHRPVEAAAVSIERDPVREQAFCHIHTRMYRPCQVPGDLRIGCPVSIISPASSNRNLRRISLRVSIFCVPALLIILPPPSIISGRKPAARNPSLQETIEDSGFFTQPSYPFSPPCASIMTKGNPYRACPPG